MGKWSPARRRGGRRRVKKPHCSRSRPLGLIARFKNEYFMLSKTMNSSTTTNSLKVLDRVHTICTLMLPHYVVLASIGSSPSSMGVTIVIMGSSSEYDFICHSALPLGLQRHVCPECEFPPAGNVIQNLLQTHPPFSYAF